MNVSIRSTVASAALKLRLRAECTPDSVTPELFMQVAHLYKDAFGHLPTEWTQPLAKVEAIVSKYVFALTEAGHDVTELVLMDLPTLRDLYEECCVEVPVTIVSTVTASGGVSTKRVA